MMNVLCWLFGSWIALQLLVSHLRDRPGVPPEYQHWTEPPIVKLQPEPWQGTVAAQGKRLLFVLFLLVVVVAFVFLVLPNLLTR